MPTSVQEKQVSTPKLGVWFALKALLLNQLLLLGGGLTGGLVLGFVLVVNHPKASPAEQEIYLQAYMSSVILLGALLGMSANVALLRVQSRHYATSGLLEPLGFTPMPTDNRLRYAGMGMGLALLYIASACLVIWMGSEPTGSGLLANLATENPLGWVTLAVIYAPWIEERVFRGQMFAGLQAVWGTRWAAVIVTAVFTLLHYSEFRYFPIGGLFILAVGVLAMGFRIRTGSIQPGYYVHLGYNATMAVYVVSLSLWRSVS